MHNSNNKEEEFSPSSEEQLREFEEGWKEYQARLASLGILDHSNTDSGVPERPHDGLVITFEPEATPEEQERFVKELSVAIIMIARHLIAMESNKPEVETIEY